MKDFQTGNPNKLKIIGFIEGTYEDEQRIHENFPNERIRSSEWFKPSIKINEYISGLFKKNIETRYNEVVEIHKDTMVIINVICSIRVILNTQADRNISHL